MYDDIVSVYNTNMKKSVMFFLEVGGEKRVALDKNFKMIGAYSDKELMSFIAVSNLALSAINDPTPEMVKYHNMLWEV